MIYNQLIINSKLFSQLHTIHQDIVRDLDPNDLANGFAGCTRELAECTVTLNSSAAVELSPDSHISPVLCDRYTSLYVTLMSLMIVTTM